MGIGHAQAPLAAACQPRALRGGPRQVARKGDVGLPLVLKWRALLLL